MCGMSEHSIIASVAGALPEHCYEQAEITETFAQVVLPDGLPGGGPQARRLLRQGGAKCSRQQQRNDSHTQPCQQTAHYSAIRSQR